MNQYIRIALAAALGFASAGAYAQSPGMGQGMMHGSGGGHGRMTGPVGMLTQQDANSATDMGLVMNLVHNNTKIKRTVTKLPDGIKTVTESDDSKIAQDIKGHVTSMSGRLKDGKEFNLFSTTLPIIFDNTKNIKSVVEFTDKGAIVTRTSTDAKVAAALQAHAGEVTELVQEGPTAFHRGLSSRMAMGPGGPRGTMNAAARSGTPAQAQQHTH